MKKSRRIQAKRKAAKDSAAVRRYLVELFEVPVTPDLGNKIVFDVSPFEADDIDYLIECFSDHCAIEFPPIRARSDLEQKAAAYVSSLNPISRYWHRLTSSSFFPYHVDITGITLEELMRAAENGLWPESRIWVPLFDA